MGPEEDRESNETSPPDSELSNGSESTDPLKKSLHPRGVFRSRTFEDFNKWKDLFECETSPRDSTRQAG